MMGSRKSKMAHKTTQKPVIPGNAQYSQIGQSNPKNRQGACHFSKNTLE
jgi:hypothetical protein